MNAMKNWIHLPLAALVALIVGLGAGLLGSPERGTQAHEAGAEVTALRATLDELRTQQAALAERLAALPAAPASVPSASRAPIQDLDAAIADYMAKQLSGED